jgi:hypothetical protein
MKRNVIFILTISSLLLFSIQIGNTINGQAVTRVNGLVFHDQSGTGEYNSATDTPLEGIAVSNGRDVVLTGADGRFNLQADGHTIIFVIKPRNWTVPVDENQMPRFYHIHSPEGATGTKFEGLAPTGKMPEMLYFPLYPSDEPDKLDVLVFGDTQPRNLGELYFISRDMISNLIGFDAAFGVTLGDNVFDDLTLFEPLVQSIGTIGLPWFYVPGNHDIDFTAGNDKDARGAWYRTFGPSYYSFTHGPAHFLVVDNIRWIVEENRRYYRTGMGRDQMEFIRNDLSRLDKDQLLVIMTHIPYVESTDWEDENEKNEYYELIAMFPNAVTFAAHTHQHYHQFLGREEGFPRDEPHHMISIGTICGSWWAGAPDEYGIPHAMMSDGTPTSYSVLHVDGNQWKTSLRAARRPADFQMHIYAPDEIKSNESGDLTVITNIFNALPSAEVEMKIGDSHWVRMERIEQVDPARIAVAEREKELGEVTWRTLGGHRISRHLWLAMPDISLKPGIHVVEIRGRDNWWDYSGKHILHVKD